MWTDLSSVLSQCTCLTDGQTHTQMDTFLIASLRWHSTQRGKSKNFFVHNVLFLLICFITVCTGQLLLHTTVHECQHM